MVADVKWRTESEVIWYILCEWMRNAISGSFRLIVFSLLYILWTTRMVKKKKKISLCTSMYNLCTSNSSEAKAQTQTARNHSISICYFSSWLSLTLLRADSPNVVISDTQLWLWERKIFCLQGATNQENINLRKGERG